MVQDQKRDASEKKAQSIEVKKKTCRQQETNF